MFEPLDTVRLNRFDTLIHDKDYEYRSFIVENVSLEEQKKL